MDRAVSLEARQVQLASRVPFDVGRARIEPAAHETVVGDKTIRLQPQVMKVLLALHDKKGDVVTREELIDRCWNGRVVGEDVINRCIWLLRRLAAEGAGFGIETVNRGGYRLVEVADQLPRRRYRLAAFALIGSAALVGAVMLLNRLAAPDDHQTLSVSISPFKSDSSLSAAASEARTAASHMLSQGGVVVTPTDDIKGSAGLLILGAFSSSGDGAKAEIQIEDPRRHAILFSREFVSSAPGGRDLPDQIGANLAASLSWAAPLLILERHHPTEPALVSQFLSQVSTEDFDQLRAFELVRRTAPQQPDSAIAQLLYSTTTGLVIGFLPKEQRAATVAAGRAAADRAMTLAPKFGDVYIPGCLLQPEVLFAKCEGQLRAGLAADPDSAFAPAILSRLLNNVGRTREATDLAYTSLAANPYAPSKIGRLSGMLELAGDRHGADRLYLQGMRWWPHNHNMFWMRYSGIIQRGDFAELARFEREVPPSDIPDHYVRASLFAHAVKSRSPAALRKICPAAASHDDLTSIECMIAMAEIGDVDGAYTFANSLYPNRMGRTAMEQQAIWLADPETTDSSYITSSVTAPLRRDPRYLALAARTGLLSYWRTERLPDFCTVEHEPVCKLIAPEPPGAATRAHGDKQTDRAGP